MALPRNRSYLGIAKETRPTPGSAPTAVAATDYIPYTTFNPVDSIKYLDDKGLRGSMAEEYDVLQGNIYSELELGGDVFPDTIGYVVAGVLGDVTTTGASAPYTHAVDTRSPRIDPDGQAGWAASTPWYRTWFTRGGGTIAASFSTSSSGERSIAVVPSLHARFSPSRTRP